jgi:hypothetical protein
MTDYEDAKYDKREFKKEKTSLSDEEKRLNERMVKLVVEDSERQREPRCMEEEEGRRRGMEGSAKEPGTIKLLFHCCVNCY